MENNDRVRPIYIEQVFKSKNPRVARMIPGFVYSFLKRLIHQDGINEFIERYGDRKGLDFADGMMEYLQISYDIIGKENLPSPDGRYIFVSNHPLGGPDGVILISFLGKHYPKLKFPVNDILLNLKNLNNIFLPINSGQNSHFFYNLANFRKAIHLNVNLEMLCLPDETFKKKGQHFTIHIGRPIPWQCLDKSKKPTEWAAAIKEEVYRLASHQ